MRIKKQHTGILILCIISFFSLFFSMPVTAAVPSTLSNSTPFFTPQVSMYYEQAYRYNVHNDKTKSYSVDYRRKSGKYPTRKGVILVTQDTCKNTIPMGHCAIIYSKNYIIQATTKGVTKSKNNWKSTKNSCFGVTVKATSVAQDAKAADWCYKKRSKPYNSNYLNVSTRKKFYCSQLIWAAFKDLYKIDLNMDYFGKAIHPVEFVNTAKTKIIYRK